MERIADVSQMLNGFPDAHRLLGKMLPVKMTQRQVWEQSLRVGRDIVERRADDVKKMQGGDGPTPPANPPDLLVVSPDGGRLQDRRRPTGERWCEYKAAVVYRVTRAGDARAGLRPDPQDEPHWRYTPACGRLAAGAKTYNDPEPEVKTFVATTEKIDRFPRYVELEAKRRGLIEADTVAVIGDGGELVWRTSREVCEARRARGKRVFEILDMIHASGHLVEAAKAAFGPSDERARWLNARLLELWAGDAEELVEALAAKAGEIGPRPGRGEAAATDEPDPVRILWNARDYFDRNRERIRYDTFRRHGLPLSSAHIESGIKQTNRRVKGSEKAWYLEHAEEMLALRCHALSEDGRWDDYFDRLRRGETELPTPGRLRAAAPEDIPEDAKDKEAA